MDKITFIDKLPTKLPSSSSLVSGNSRGGGSSGTTTAETAVVGTTSQSNQIPSSEQQQQVTTQQVQNDEAAATATTEAKKKALNEALTALQSNNTSLDFSIDQTSGVLVVKVVDKATGDVVRQIPAEEVLVMRQQAEKMRGVLFNKVM